MSTAQTILSDVLTFTEGMHDLPIEALAPVAELETHTMMCGWCDTHTLCSIGTPLARAAWVALKGELVGAAAL